MVRVASLFSQLLREVPREDFVGLVQKHRAERFAKGFSCWTQLIAAHDAKKMVGRIFSRVALTP